MVSLIITTKQASKQLLDTATSFFLCVLSEDGETTVSTAVYCMWVWVFVYVCVCVFCVYMCVCVCVCVCVRMGEKENGRQFNLPLSQNLV